MRIPACRVLELVTSAAMALSIIAPPVAAAASATPASMVGVYDGGQMEMAAGLEIGADGRFRYQLSYGALDETATGRWAVQGDHIVLTSDRVVAPRYVVVSQAHGEDGVLRVLIDFKDPYDQQHFDALITKADGTVATVQLGIDGLSWRFATANPPVSVRLLFGVFGLVSEPLPLNEGHLIHYRFEPNDLGKVDFRAAPVTIAGDTLLLDRHGTTITFRRVKP